MLLTEEEKMLESKTILSIEASNLKTLWYDKSYIQDLLLLSVNKKELALKSKSFDEYTIRAFSIDNSIKGKSFLNYIFGFYSVLKRDYNLYISPSYYYKIPFFDMNLKFRSKFTSQWFSTQAENEIYAYDMLLDFDRKLNNFIDMKTECNKMLWILNKFNIKYYIIPSGSSFQILVKNTLSKDWAEIKEWTLQIKENLGLKFLDLKGIGTPFKLMKCPYSIVGNLVCLPLNDVMIKNFMSLNYGSFFEIKKILASVKLENRGLMWQNDTDNIDIINDNLHKFLEFCEVLI